MDRSSPSPRGSGVETREESVQKLGFYLQQQLELRGRDYASGSQRLCITAPMLRLVGRLLQFRQKRDAEVPQQETARGRGGSLFTQSSEGEELGESPVALLYRSGVGPKLLKGCASVSSLEVDGRDERKSRVYSFDAFPGLRALSIRNANVLHVSGVRSVASLSLHRCLLADDLGKFATLRSIAFGATDLADHRTLPALCFSLRSVTVTVGDSGVFVPSFLPTAAHLRTYDRATVQVEPWDGLTSLTMRGATEVISERLAGGQKIKLNPSLQYLQALARVQLTGLRLQSLDGLEPMCNCASLLAVDLSGNALRSLEPAAALPKSITRLSVADNLLSGIAFGALDRLEKLVALDVSANDVTQWTSFGMLPPLAEVCIAGNPVHNDGVQLYEGTDEYLTFVASVVLPDGVIVVDGHTLGDKHRRPRDHPSVRKWRSTITNLRSAASRDPSRTAAGQESRAVPRVPVTAQKPSVAASVEASSVADSSVAPSSTPTQVPPAAGQPPKSALKRGPKPKVRKGARLRTVGQGARPVAGDADADVDTGGPAIIEDAATLKVRRGDYYLEQNMFAKKAEPAGHLAGASASNEAGPGAAEGQATSSEHDVGAPIPEKKSQVLRRQPAQSETVPLLARFVAQLREHEWVITEGDKKRKLFPSGVVVDESEICDENAPMWEANDAQGVIAGDGAREFLLRDSRKEQQGQDASRFAGKQLIRVVETVTGRTRHLRVEAKPRGGSFGGRRPALMMTFTSGYESAALDVRVVAAFADEAASDDALRPRASTLAPDMLDDRGSPLLHVEMVGESGRALHQVEAPQLMAAFAVPVAAGASFMELLRHQLVSCHSALVANGIVRQWPLHSDSDARGGSEDLAHALPVLGATQLFIDQLRGHEGCRASRQRHGATCVFSRDDELHTHLATRVLNSEARVNAVIYAHTWELPGAPKPSASVRGHGSASLVVITSESVVWLKDLNYTEAHPNARYVQESSTFGPPTVQRLSDLSNFQVTFDAQHFVLAFKGVTLACSTLDRGATLSVAGALAQVDLVSVGGASRASGKQLLEVLPCPYPFLTTSPLIFSVSVFMCAPTATACANGFGGSDVFPLRHISPAVRERMQLANFVATPTDVMVVQLDNPLAAASTAASPTVTLRSQLLDVIDVRVASGPTLFPLLFVLHTLSQEGEKKPWLFCAPHPATIACIVRHLQQQKGSITVGELTESAFSDLVASTRGVATAVEL